MVLKSYLIFSHMDKILECRANVVGPIENIKVRNIKDYLGIRICYFKTNYLGNNY